MQNHLEILEEIDKLFADNELENERQQLEFETRASSTGSELCLRSASKLLALQNKSKRVDKVVGNQIKELVSYCHSNGLYPKPNYED